MKGFLTVGTFASLLTLAGVVQAMPIVYDFTGNANNNPLGLGTGDLGFNMTTVIQDGLSVTISGLGFNPTRDLNLHRTARNGLGVIDGGLRPRVGRNEAIEFDFSAETVLGIETMLQLFANTNNTGSLEVLVDDVVEETITWLANTNVQVLYEFDTTTPPGSVFTFRGKAQSFRIAMLTVESVPEPSTLALMVIGLAGVGFARKPRLTAWLQQIRPSLKTPPLGGGLLSRRARVLGTLVSRRGHGARSTAAGHPAP